MPAAPTIINFVHTDMDESMNNTSAIRSSVIEQITIHSSGSEMRVSDISIQSEFTGRRVGSDETSPTAQCALIRPLDAIMPTLWTIRRLIDVITTNHFLMRGLIDHAQTRKFKTI